jgi:xylan 1,4-beta-xylosidase
MSSSDSRDIREARATVRVQVDQREPLRRIWRYVGYDEPNYTYTANGRLLLSKLGQMADAPYFIRCHFMLCSGDGTGSPKWGSSNVYTEDADGRPVYSWAIIDRILDTILETGNVPFVEIGFMPQALSSAPPDLPYEGARAEGWRYPPKDYGKWRDLIYALGQHCLERYGLREVSRWYWELWNEPDISYWRGTVEEYCRLYDYTVEGLLAAILQAKVGGPGTTSPGRPEAGAYLEAFLEHCLRGTNAVTGGTGTRLDYVSFHTKGGGYGVEPGASKKTPTLHTLVRHVDAGLGILAGFPELRGHEVNLSECDPDGWAAGSIRENPNLAYRNTEYYASYVACAVCKLIDRVHVDGPRVDGMLTWAFQFEDRELFAGLRTLSTDGIDKPVLNVFRLLAGLGGARCHLVSDKARDPVLQEGADNGDTPPDVSGVAAIDQVGTVQVFLCSHHDDWDVHQPTSVAVRLSGLEAGRRYVAYCTMVDERHGNAHTAWVLMGKPRPPSAEQRLALQEASRLKPDQLGEVVAADGIAELSITLRAHSVCLLELVPV